MPAKGKAKGRAKAMKGRRGGKAARTPRKAKAPEPTDNAAGATEEYTLPRAWSKILGTLEKKEPVVAVKQEREHEGSSVATLASDTQEGENAKGQLEDEEDMADEEEEEEEEEDDNEDEEEEEEEDRKGEQGKVDTQTQPDDAQKRGRAKKGQMQNDLIVIYTKEGEVEKVTWTTKGGDAVDLESADDILSLAHSERQRLFAKLEQSAKQEGGQVPMRGVIK